MRPMKQMLYSIGEVSLSCSSAPTSTGLGIWLFDVLFTATIRSVHVVLPLRKRQINSDLLYLSATERLAHSRSTGLNAYKSGLSNPYKFVVRI